MNVECVVLQWYVSGFTICPLCKPSFEVRNCCSHKSPEPLPPDTTNPCGSGYLCPNTPAPPPPPPTALFLCTPFSLFNWPLFTSTTIPVQLAKHKGPCIKCVHAHLSSLKSSFLQSKHNLYPPHIPHPPPPPPPPPTPNHDSKLGTFMHISGLPANESERSRWR